MTDAAEPTPPPLPVMLRLDGWRCVVVGGGSVALRRAVTLQGCGGRVTLMAPRFDPAVEALGGVTRIRRAYRGGDLRGARLVVIATDDPGANEQVAQDAAALGVLVNRADDPA